MSAKPWLLLSQAEKDAFGEGPEDKSGLLAAGLHASIQKNKELYKEIEILKTKLKELQDASK